MGYSPGFVELFGSWVWETELELRYAKDQPFQSFGNLVLCEKGQKRACSGPFVLFSNGIVGSEVCAIACMVSLFGGRVFCGKHCMVGATLFWLL